MPSFSSGIMCFVPACSVFRPDIVLESGSDAPMVSDVGFDLLIMEGEAL